MQSNIEDIVKIIIKHFELNHISVVNNPSEVDIPLNK